ncbi:hypothetical protein [Rhodosalinus sp. FB01]|uniref:hypothetical protein n=1 Tax=Rhodosalinus sp. FB01 TaxID=3239194 RepID=UPI0035237875
MSITRTRASALALARAGLLLAAPVAAFFNMTSRLASASDMRPNVEYHAHAR